MATFKKTFSIYKNDDLIYSTQRFDKDHITKIFEDAIHAAKEGDEIEYGWDEKGKCYGPELIVEIRAGKPKQWVYTSGRFVGYKDYEFKMVTPLCTHS